MVVEVNSTGEDEASVGSGSGNSVALATVNYLGWATAGVGASGVVTNMVSLVVFRAMAERSCSNAVLVWLAVYDLLICLVWSIRSGGPFEHVESTAISASPEICKLLRALMNMVTMGNASQENLLSVDRLYAVFRPFSYRTRVTPSTGHKASLMVALLLLGVSAPTYFAYDTPSLSYTKYVKCRPVADTWARVYVFSFIYIAIASLAAVCLSNSVILWKITRQRKAVKSSRAKRSDSATVVLLTISTIHFFLVGIAVLIRILVARLDMMTEAGLRRYFIYYAIQNFVKVLNSAFNFFVYLALNERFRGTLKALLHIPP